MFTKTKLVLALSAFLIGSGLTAAHATVVAQPRFAKSLVKPADVTVTPEVAQRFDRRSESPGFDSQLARGEPQPGDVRGEGKGHKYATDLLLTRGEPQPGDVRGEGKGHKYAPDLLMAREANEPPRGQDNEPAGDRQHRGKGGKGKFSDEMLLAREAGEPPRGQDNEPPGDRHHRGKGGKVVS